MPNDCEVSKNIIVKKEISQQIDDYTTIVKGLKTIL